MANSKSISTLILLLTTATLLPNSALAQRGVRGFRDATDHQGEDFDWLPETQGDWELDTFGNSFYYENNGNYHYIDTHGDSWFHNETVDEWEGSDEEGNSWYYAHDGTQKFWAIDGDVWEQYPDNTEIFYANNGDKTITLPSGQQDFYEKLANGEDAYDHYIWYPNGNESYYGDDGDIWLWEENQNQWSYYDKEDDVWWGSKGNKAWVVAPQVSSIEFDKAKEQYIFTDSNGAKFYYYPQWSWGNQQQEWFLYNDLHDEYVQNH